MCENTLEHSQIRKVFMNDLVAYFPNMKQTTEETAQSACVFLRNIENKQASFKWDFVCHCHIVLLLYLSKIWRDSLVSIRGKFTVFMFILFHPTSSRGRKLTIK